MLRILIVGILMAAFLLTAQADDTIIGSGVLGMAKVGSGGACGTLNLSNGCVQPSLFH